MSEGRMWGTVAGLFVAAPVAMMLLYGDDFKNDEPEPCSKGFHRYESGEMTEPAEVHGMYAVEWPGGTVGPWGVEVCMDAQWLDACDLNEEQLERWRELEEAVIVAGIRGRCP